MPSTTAKTTLLAAAVLLAASPAALAGWGMMGSYEPDTKLDVTGGWMFQSPDISTSQSVRDVYLNGYFGQCGIDEYTTEQCTGLNPNVATLRTSTHPPEYILTAMLGVWKDCNKDGYVGLADQGLFEYRAELLTDTSVCPKQDTPRPIPLNWFPTHNDGTWVREFLPIDPLTSTPAVQDTNPWNVNDAAKVWADVGRPGDFRFTCYYSSYPAGTFHSTGFLLHTFDCLDGYKATDTFDSIVALNQTTQPLSFADHARDQENSKSPLNVKNPWGTTDQGSDVTLWDCGHQVFRSSDHQSVNAFPIGEWWINVSMPRVPTVGTSGSVAGTAAAVGSGFDDCRTHGGFQNEPENANTQNHLGDDLGNAPYARESGTNLAPYKVSTDSFSADVQSRPAAPFAAVIGQATPQTLGLEWTPDGCAVVVVGVNCFGMDGVWHGNRIYHQETVFTDANGGGASKAAYFTYYAYVTPTAVSTYGLLLPKGATATGTYGVEACGTHTGGIWNQWDCDRSHWPGYVATSPNDNTAPGSVYDLRDVDCYDESAQAARALGAGYGLVTGSAECDSTP